MRFQRRVGRKDAFHRTAVAQEFLRQMDALAEKKPPARAFCAPAAARRLLTVSFVLDVIRSIPSRGVRRTPSRRPAAGNKKTTIINIIVRFLPLSIFFFPKQRARFSDRP